MNTYEEEDREGYLQRQRSRRRQQLRQEEEAEVATKVHEREVFDEEQARLEKGDKQRQAEKAEWYRRKAQRNAKQK